MAFQIRCPSCQKLYAAEDRMLGKRMRCKNCASVFTIEAPAQEPSLAASTLPGVDVHSLNAADLTGTRRAEAVPPSPPRPVEEEDEPVVQETPFLRPSIPQDFPMSQVVEAWLPLALGLIAAVWAISQTFSANDTGRSWVPMLRAAILAGLYLGVVVPLTYKSVKINFAKMRRLLPPSPMTRTALTFALPAAMGYEFWQASEGTGGFVTGLLLGVALMAAVFWLLFRLNPQEAASAYSWVAGTFLATSGICALLLVGASAVLNRSMISDHAATAFKESPLGEPLAWNIPEPVTKPLAKVPTGADPWLASAGQPKPPQPQPGRQQEAPPNGASTTTPDSASTGAQTPILIASENLPVEPVSNPPKTNKPAESIFANPEDDSFTDSIRKANLPWVKSISRADGQAPFDFTINPHGQSRFIGLVTSDGTNARHVMLEPANAALPAIMDDEPTVETFSSRYLLTGDGRAFLHIRGGRELEMIPTAEAPRDPTQLDVAPASRVPLHPALVGLMRDANVVIRWSAPDATEQCVYRYSYLTRSKLSKSVIKGALTTPDLCAVSGNPTGPMFYAWLSQMPAKHATLNMVNLFTPTNNTRNCIIPSDIMDVTTYERGELSFSPDGTKVALVLEQGDTAQVMAWPTADSVNSVSVRVACKAPTQSETAGRIRGPSVCWINNAFFIVYGRTVVSTRGGTVGNLTDALVIGEQTTPDYKVYLSYLLPDAHLHLATVEFDPAALARAPLSRPSAR